jgi:hypothetical protein
MWKHLHHFFIPHHANNHRAKALHHDSLLVYLLVFALLNFGLKSFSRSFPDVLGYATDIRVDALLSETNRERTAAGLQPLVLNGQLSDAAAKKASDMFAHNYWAHTSPQGKTPWEFIVGSGYRYLLAGENLAKNFSTSTGVVNAWMASPTHRENIIKPGYRDVGFAIVNGVLLGEETTLVVQEFGATERLADAAPKPVMTPIPTAVPVAQEVAAPAVKPVELPNEEAPSVAGSSVPSTPNQSVIKMPTINVLHLSRDIAILFAGAMMVILGLDFYIVSKNRIPRVTGHNIAHVLFFGILLIAILTLKQGLTV